MKQPRNCYSAPELQRDRDCASGAVDVFSMATVVCFMRMRRDPGIPDARNCAAAAAQPLVEWLRWGRLAGLMGRARAEDAGARLSAQELMEALEEAQLQSCACSLS